MNIQLSYCFIFFITTPESSSLPRKKRSWPINNASNISGVTMKGEMGRWLCYCFIGCKIMRMRQDKNSQQQVFGVGVGVLCGEYEKSRVVATIYVCMCIMHKGYTYALHICIKCLQRKTQERKRNAASRPPELKGELSLKFLLIETGRCGLFHSMALVWIFSIHL